MKALAFVAWLVLWPIARAICTWCDFNAGIIHDTRVLGACAIVDVMVWVGVGIFLGVKL